MALLEILLERILFRHIHTISKINFILIVILGGVAFLGEEGIWFKLQPFFTGVGLGGILWVQNFRGKSIMWKMLEEFPNKVPPPRPLVEMMERHMSIFMLFYGIFMGAVAIWCSTKEWLFLKTIGFYIAFFLFFIGEIILLRSKIRG